MSQYIGKTISLVSNKGLRYVGLLDNINAETATVSLKLVRSFGTEGRMAALGQPTMEVGPGADVYDYVVFRGSDVKDLSVLDTPIDEVKPQYQGAAPTATAAPLGSPQNPPATTTAPAPRRDAAPAARAAPPAETAAPKAIKQTAPAPTRTTSEAPTRTQEQQPVPMAEFDFEQANSRFEKEQQESKPVYDRKSLFFDGISSSTDERPSMRWSEEKNLNLDTFGESSVRRGRGNFRGRGRGNFRGRGRGKGREEPKPEWA